jgi:hypothetical protein
VGKRKRVGVDAFVEGGKPTKAAKVAEPVKDRQQIFIDRALRYHIAVVARENRTTISAMAEEALRDHLAKLKRPVPA